MENGSFRFFGTLPYVENFAERLSSPRPKSLTASVATWFHFIVCYCSRPQMVETNTSENPITESLDGTPEDRAQLHDLLPFTIGDQTFAVFTDQIDATAETRPLAVLPKAPPAVVGVVCVRGHMITVLDAAAILSGSERQWPATLPFVLVLRGDDQLGLAAETCRDTVTISAEDVDATDSSDESSAPVALGTVTYAGERIIILDAVRLFRRAVQRRERRRRRF
jgi:purine-binding chemotaxis protein CheW